MDQATDSANSRLQLVVRRIKHSRKARRIEQALIDKDGITKASVSVSGVLQLEWDSNKISQAEVLESIEKLGLTIQGSKQDDRSETE